MSVNRVKANVGYGLTNALQNLSPQPIISNRNPKTSDLSELGTLWINKLTNAYYIATSTTAGATNWEAQSTGSGTFAAVNVTGAVGNTLQVTADTILGGGLSVGGSTSMTGDLAVVGNVTVTGDFDITDTSAVSITSTDNAPKAIYLHTNGGAAETLEIHSDQGTGSGSVFVHSDVGGVVIQSAGLVNNAAVNLLASSGGFQLDGVLTSSLNVVGAGEDINLVATGGSIHATSTEASATAISLTASDAAGKVAITGVGGITIATTNTAIGVTSGTGAISIGTDAVAKTITVGNVIGATGLVLNSGTNGIAMASTGAGDITLASSDTVLIDSAGVLELNSSAGVISIGNDADAFGVNIGTGAAARPVIIGSTTAGTTVTLNTPALTPVVATNGLSVTTAAQGITLPGGITITTGAGAPGAPLATAIGCVYINTTAASAVTRMYICDAIGTWVNVTTSA